jgi:hypothetical protein
VFGSFILNIVVEQGLKKTRTGEFQIWNDIFSSRIDSDVIISGSSRAWVHIDPRILDSILHVNSYNLGIDGYPFHMQFIRYLIFEKYNKKPKLIVQNVDFFTLYRRKDPYNKIQFLPYAQEELLQQELKIMGVSKFDIYIPILSYQREFLYQGLREFFNIEHYSDNRYKGYRGWEKEWNGFELEQMLLKDSIVSKIEPESIQLFDSFLNHCKRNNIQIILVFTPYYIKATEFTKNKDEVINIYRFFSEKYDIPFLDYSHDSLCYDTLYFYNAMHLNKKGSELFSLKLANDINTQNLYK